MYNEHIKRLQTAGVIIMQICDIRNARLVNFINLNPIHASSRFTYLNKLFHVPTT